MANIGSDARRGQRGGGGPHDGGAGRGQDEVSMAVAALFSGHAQAYQALSAQAAAFHAQFVKALIAVGCPMRPRSRQRLTVAVLRSRICSYLAINTPSPGTDRAPADRQRRQRGPGDGQNGEPGGWLFGDGGAGGSGAPGSGRAGGNRGASGLMGYGGAGGAGGGTATGTAGPAGPAGPLTVSATAGRRRGWVQ